ncbi:MAG: NAD(P)/FAD-dependent oxidoreductase [Candidatus Micrarchaeota archaeon]|nr:NAD(P)/FAD-dependent oxidoreductase [Candidatus Micrarchaeota archaeon]
MTTVSVIGGGPAGCFAAKSAAESGAQVTLYEEHARIGEPVQCAGLISKKGLLSLMKNDGFVINTIRSAKICSPNSRIRINCADETALVIDRAKFDAACARGAEEAGAVIRTGCRAKPNRMKGVIIGADGPNSTVANLFGFPKCGPFVSTFQTDYENVEIEDGHEVSIFLSADFRGLFGWLIPTGSDTARVGVGVSPPLSAGKAFQKLAGALLNLENARPISSASGVIPLFPRSITAKKNVFLAGDAAGQVKSISGGGIFFGCTCAGMAGKVAATTASANEYEREWRALFWDDMVLHYRIRRLMNSLSDSHLNALVEISSRVGVPRLLSRYGDMDLPTSLFSVPLIGLPARFAYNVFNSLFPIRS